MELLDQIKFLLRITDTHDIVRRYFVVNGFDGALAMLGLIIGFIVSMPVEISTVINACLGAAIALGASGISSAYITEAAELKNSLAKLEDAMVSDLQESSHGKAARITPFIIALVNGLAPLAISILILTPLWLSHVGYSTFISPLYASAIVALIITFLLGVFLGRIAKSSWLRSGLQAMLVALLTALLIYIFAES